MQSGCSLNPWTVQKSPLAVATKLAKALGCSSDSTNDILDCLQSAAADDIVIATKTMSKDKEFMKSLGLAFIPCIQVSGTDPFLADSPEKLMKRGDFKKVPVIIGSAVNEGSVAFLFDGVNERQFEIINKKPEHLVPSFLGLKPGSTEEKKAEKEIWDFYFQGKPISWDNVNQYLMFQSDILFNIGIENTRTNILEKSTLPVYRYLFSNHSRCICAAFKAMIPDNELCSETCHGADCRFIYVLNMFPVQEITPKDKVAIREQITAWTSFAATGDPNCAELKIPWERDSESKPCFMDIGTPWTMKEGIPFSERIAFWKTLHLKNVTA